MRIAWCARRWLNSHVFIESFRQHLIRIILYHFGISINGNRRGEPLKGLRMYVVPKLAELSFHASAMPLSGRLAFADV